MKPFSTSGFIEIDCQVAAPDDKVAELLGISITELHDLADTVGVTNSTGGIYEIKGKYYFSSPKSIFDVRNQNGRTSADLSTSELMNVFERAEERLLPLEVIKIRKFKRNEEKLIIFIVVVGLFIVYNVWFK